MYKFYNFFFFKLSVTKKKLAKQKINNPDATSVGVQCSMFCTVCSHKVVAVGFNTLCYDAERCRGRRVLNRTNKSKITSTMKVFKGFFYIFSTTLRTCGAAAGLSYARKRDPQPTFRQGYKYTAPYLSGLHSDNEDLRKEG